MSSSEDSSSCNRGMIVPGGFGSRGIEGKILAARYARERKIPYLGKCRWQEISCIIATVAL